MANIIKARRKLDELYKTGVEVRIAPGPDGPVGSIAPGGEGYFKDANGQRLPLPEDNIALWIQPPSPLQREMALRDAQGARARALLRARRDEDSEEYLTVLAFLADMSDETLYDYIVINDNEQRRTDAMREVLAEEEWENVTELQDAMRLFAEDPPIEGTESYEEYQELLKRDAVFGEQVAKREKELREAQLEALRMKGRAAAEKDAVKKRADIAGSQAFVYEYQRKMLFFAVRDIDETKQLFFESATQMEEQPDEFQAVIAEALDHFITEGVDAKNSPRAESGSDSSEPPNKPETSEASIPQELSA